MPNVTRVLLMTAALLAGAFAGCIGGDDEPVDATTSDSPGSDLSQQKPADQQDSLGWIFGQVTDLVSNASLKGVNVSLAQGLGAALTDDAGRYVIANVPRGEYILSAKAESGYLLSRYAISVFPDQGTEMNFKLQPEDAVEFEEIQPVVWTKYYMKETSGADYLKTLGALDVAPPEGAPAANEWGHPQTGGFGVTSMPDGIAGGRPAARMGWEIEFKEAFTLHADTENPVEFPDPSYPGGDVKLVRFSAMTIQYFIWKPDAAFLWSMKVEDVAPDGSAELLALRSEFVGGGTGPEGVPAPLDLEMPFLKRGKEFHTFQPGHKLRITYDDSSAWYVVHFFDGEQYPTSIDLRRGPYLEPPVKGDRIVLTYNGHTKAGASNPYGIAWVVPVPPEADPVINPLGIHRTGAGGYYVGTACPQGQSDCVGDTTVFFDVPQGAQTVYTRLEFTAPPVREPSALLNDYDILLYEPSGKAHTHTAGYGGNQAEIQFHDVFETPEWPQKWWVEIFAFLVVESDWTCTVEIVF